MSPDKRANFGVRNLTRHPIKIEIADIVTSQATLTDLQEFFGREELKPGRIAMCPIFDLNNSFYPLGSFKINLLIEKIQQSVVLWCHPLRNLLEENIEPPYLELESDKEYWVGEKPGSIMSSERTMSAKDYIFKTYHISYKITAQWYVSGNILCLIIVVEEPEPEAPSVRREKLLEAILRADDLIAKMAFDEAVTLLEPIFITCEFEDIVEMASQRFFKLYEIKGNETLKEIDAIKSTSSVDDNTEIIGKYTKVIEFYQKAIYYNGSKTNLLVKKIEDLELLVSSHKRLAEIQPSLAKIKEMLSESNIDLFKNSKDLMDTLSAALKSYKELINGYQKLSESGLDVKLELDTCKEAFKLGSRINRILLEDEFIKSIERVTFKNDDGGDYSKGLVERVEVEFKMP